MLCPLQQPFNVGAMQWVNFGFKMEGVPLSQSGVKIKGLSGWILVLVYNLPLMSVCLRGHLAGCMELTRKRSAQNLVILLIRLVLSSRVNLSPLPGSKIVISACGQANTRRGRIIDGSNTAVNEFPWMAAIVDTRKAPQPGCGGALINANYVITAAHCTERYMWAICSRWQIV